MQILKIYLMSLAVALAAACLPGSVLADELCPDASQKAKAKGQMQQVKSLQSNSKLREAWSALEKVAPDCADIDATRSQIGKAIGAEEEKNGRAEQALEWYLKVSDDASAKRLYMKLLESRPEDQALASRALAYFYAKGDKTSEQAIRAIAKRNVEKRLAQEEMQFAAALKASESVLENARAWTFYAQWGEVLVRNRAQQRGDTLAKEDGRNALKKAMAFYAIGEWTEKIKAVKTKAANLGKLLESKGEFEAAVEYYEIAELSDKAQALSKRAEQATQKKEEVRQKNFKKDQDDLEKKLGM